MSSFLLLSRVHLNLFGFPRCPALISRSWFWWKDETKFVNFHVVIAVRLFLVSVFIDFIYFAMFAFCFFGDSFIFFVSVICLVQVSFIFLYSPSLSTSFCLDLFSSLFFFFLLNYFFSFPSHFIYVNLIKKNSTFLSFIDFVCF